mmetsp:Transcript_18762/g.57705  ORF Transcript_18762/g.57705 Transcript_18762/m.57705 type:complete len:240 (+) Transcript_18762:947-1666(+)
MGRRRRGGVARDATHGPVRRHVLGTRALLHGVSHGLRAISCDGRPVGPLGPGHPLDGVRGVRAHVHGPCHGARRDGRCGGVADLGGSERRRTRPLRARFGFRQGRLAVRHRGVCAVEVERRHAGGDLEREVVGGGSPSAGRADRAGAGARRAENPDGPQRRHAPRRRPRFGGSLECGRVRGQVRQRRARRREAIDARSATRSSAHHGGGRPLRGEAGLHTVQGRVRRVGCEDAAGGRRL